MGFLLSKNKAVRYGAMIDIGSGSVLVAIIASNENKNHPEILWAKREYTPLRHTGSLSESAKHVMTSLLNALMLLDSEGRKILREETGVNQLPHCQVTIAAPWSYTVTKTISYGHEESFVVTDALIEELLRTAHKKVNEELEENERIQQLGLKIITRSTTGIFANGYLLAHINDQNAKSLKIVESNAIAQEYLTEAIENVRDKVLPDTDLRLYSFILIFYYIIRDLFPETTEYCLVDITYEATELGIVRDGILQYSTHVAKGAFTLAREIATVLDIPLEEAYGYLQNEDPISLLTNTTDAKIAAVTEIFQKYQDSLTTLFHETGDSLAIPKKVYLHGNIETEPFFKQILANAAQKATSSTHAVYPVSRELLTKHYDDTAQESFIAKRTDTALLISAQFFHTRSYQSRFEQF